MRHFSSAGARPPDDCGRGVAFLLRGVIVNYNTASVTGDGSPARAAMNKPKTREQTMRMLTILAIACLTLASMMA